MSLTLPGLKLTSGDYDYEFGKSSISGDVKISLPLLTADDTFACVNHPQTLTNKTMGDALIMGNNKITGLGTPTNAGDATTKVYVDSIAAGLSIKVPCRVATQVNVGTYAEDAGSPIANGQFTSAPSTIDGVTLADGDRILVFNQTDKKENGIYVATATTTTWNRASNYDEAAEVNDGDFVMVQEGTVSSGRGYTQLNAVATVGTSFGDNIDFTEFCSLSDLVGGDGIVKTGNSIATDIKSSSGLKITSGQLDTDLLLNGGVIYAAGLKVDLSGSSIAGSVTETKGGTGQTTYTTGDILYSSSANTLSKLPVGTNGNVLTLATGTPSWAAPATPTLENVLLSGNTAGSTNIDLQANNLLCTGTLFSNTGVIKIGSTSVAGTNGVSVGSLTTSGVNCVSVGRFAQSTGIECVTIGVNSNSSTFNYNVVIGSNATSNAEGVAIGRTTKSGINCVSIGRLADCVSSSNSITIGDSAITSADNNILIGTNTTANISGISLGTTAASGTSSISIGSSTNTSTSTNSVAIGSSAVTNGASISGAVAIGNLSSAKFTNSIAIGNTSIVTDFHGVAIGNLSDSALRSVSIGRLARGTGPDCVAIGNGANTNTSSNAIAIGVSTSSSLDGVAIGNGALSSTNSVCIGRLADCSSGFESVTIGRNAVTTSNDNILIGSSTAALNSGISLGTTASSGVGSISIGSATDTSATTNGVAIGSSASTSGESAIAIGNTSSAGFANSISLGKGAVTAAVNECVIGNGSITHIRPLTATSSICDIGSATHPYRDVNLQRDLKFLSGGDIKNVNGINPTSGTVVSTGGRLKVRSTDYTEAAINHRIFRQTVVNTVTGTSDPTSLFGAGLGTTTIPANSLAVGDIISVKAQGFLTNPTFQSFSFELKLGGTSLATNTYSTTEPSETFWKADISFVVLSLGASGSINVCGEYRVDNNSESMLSTSSITINTTINLLIEFLVDPSGSSVSVTNQMCEITTNL